MHRWKAGLGSYSVLMSALGCESGHIGCQLSLAWLGSRQHCREVVHGWNWLEYEERKVLC